MQTSDLIVHSRFSMLSSAATLQHPVSSMKPLEKSKRKRKGWKERLGRKRLKGNDRLAAFMNIRRTNFSRFCLLGARVANAQCAMGCASGMRMCARRGWKVNVQGRRWMRKFASGVFEWTRKCASRVRGSTCYCALLRSYLAKYMT